MIRNRNTTTACKACKGRGWHDKHYPHTTIESIMPHGDHAYMCPSCTGLGQCRTGARRIAMTHRFGPNKKHRLKVNRNSIWRIYHTLEARHAAAKAIRAANGGRLFYINSWEDANGYGLHIVRNEEVRP